jgi:hypothetical protein
VKLEVNLTFFAPWLQWQRPPILICSTPQQLSHTTVDIPTKFHEVWWKESKIILNPPFFVSMATAAKWWRPLLLCNGNSSYYYYSSTHFCPLYFSEKPWSNFMKPCRNIICHLTFFAPWLPWQRPPILICSTPQQLPHTTVDIPTKCHEVFSKWLPLPWKRPKC